MRTRRTTRTVIAAVASVAMLTSLPALAEPEASASDAALAETLFREGRNLLEAGEVETACAKLAESYRIDARVGTLMNLAACHEMAGKTATAWAEFLDAARLSRARATPEARKLEATAEQRAKDLEPKINQLEIVVAAPAEDLVLLLDGRPLASAAWSTPLPIDPGRHVLEARRPGYMHHTQTVDITGSGGRLLAHVPALSPEKAAPEPPTLLHVEPPPPSRLSRPVFLASGGASVIAAGVGTFFGFRAMGAKDARDAACEGGACSADGLAHQRDAFDAATASTICFAVGVAAASVAVVSLLWPAQRSAVASPGAALQF